MPWKMDGDKIVVKDGNPVWVEGDKEIGVDYSSLSSKLNDVTRESVGRKEKIRELEARMTVLDGIDDPDKFFAEARKALDTVKHLDDKKLIDAGDVEKVKNEITKAMQAKIDEATKGRDAAEQALQRELIGGNFARSKFISDKLAIPVDVAEAFFSKHFSVKDGKVVSKGYDGADIYSPENPGQLASFDEALSKLVDGYPNKAAILKGSTASGGGANPGGGAGGAGTRTISRAEFSKLDPASQMSFFKDGKGAVVD
jgi:hypothetical protein